MVKCLINFLRVLGSSLLTHIFLIKFFWSTLLCYTSFVVHLLPCMGGFISFLNKSTCHKFTNMIPFLLLIPSTCPFLYPCLIDQFIVPRQLFFIYEPFFPIHLLLLPSLSLAPPFLSIFLYFGHIFHHLYLIFSSLFHHPSQTKPPFGHHLAVADSIHFFSNTTWHYCDHHLAPRSKIIHFPLYYPILFSLFWFSPPSLLCHNIPLSLIFPFVWFSPDLRHYTIVPPPTLVTFLFFWRLPYLSIFLMSSILFSNQNPIFLFSLSFILFLLNVVSWLTLSSDFLLNSISSLTKTLVIQHPF